MKRRQMDIRMFVCKDAKNLIGKRLSDHCNAFEIENDFLRLLNAL